MAKTTNMFWHHAYGAALNRLNRYGSDEYLPVTLDCVKLAKSLAGIMYHVVYIYSYTCACISLDVLMTN